MDLHHFDTFTRALANGHSRRGALALLGSLLAAPVLARRVTEAKKKKKKKVTVCLNNQAIKVAKKKRDRFLLSGATLGACPTSPPPGPPPGPPPPPPSCTSTGCPFYEVCVADTCVDCNGAECNSDNDCCTESCDNNVCVCWFGGAAPDGGCTSNAQCCNGSCNFETKRCNCDPPGSPCPFGINGCCSGNCVNDVCR